MYDTVFTEERVKVVVKRMLNDLQLVKRKGHKVATDLLKSKNYEPQSNFWALGTFRQMNFLQDLSNRLQSSPQSVIDDLNKLREHITSLDNLTIHVSLNPKNVMEAIGTSDLAAPWLDTFLPAKLRLSVDGSRMTNAVVPCSNLVKKETPVIASIAGVGSVESNFMQQTVDSIKSFTDPDLAPLLVLMQYLTQLEVCQ